MADDRKFHRRAMRSVRIAALSDLEYRVWATYELIADDCGVMPATVAELQAGNIALEQRKPRELAAALAKLIAVELVYRYEHQGRPFVCQLDWQDFQQVRFPRESHYPTPPAELLASMTPATVDLFRLRLRLRTERDQKSLRKVPEPVPSDFGSISEMAPHPTGAPDRAKPLTSNPNHQPSEGFGEESPRETPAIVPVGRPIRPQQRIAAEYGEPIGRESRQHLGCIVAPAACARNKCVPAWMGRQWLAQLGGDTPQNRAKINALALDALAPYPEGAAIPGTPKSFHEAAWAAAHPLPAPVGRTKTATQHAIDAAREFLDATDTPIPLDRRALEPHR